MQNFLKRLRQYVSLNCRKCLKNSGPRLGFFNPHTPNWCIFSTDATAKQTCRCPSNFHCTNVSRSSGELFESDLLLCGPCGLLRRGSAVDPLYFAYKQYMTGHCCCIHQWQTKYRHSRQLMLGRGRRGYRTHWPIFSRNSSKGAWWTSQRWHRGLHSQQTERVIPCRRLQPIYRLCHGGFRRWPEQAGLTKVRTCRAAGAMWRLTACAQGKNGGRRHCHVNDTLKLQATISLHSRSLSDAVLCAYTWKAHNCTWQGNARTPQGGGHWGSSTQQFNH